MNKKLYKQCKIAKGNAQYTAWVSADLAKINKVVVSKNLESVIIKEVYNGIVLTHHQLVEYYRAENYGEEII
jgi:hypothetical protein